MAACQGISFFALDGFFGVVFFYCFLVCQDKLYAFTEVL